ncbi:MAG: pseudouridine synthase [Cyanobacteria bacterium P01_A01_bin.123]
MEERLQKLLSQWGVASRRRSEDLILAKRVKINDAIAILGQKADPACDIIQVDGIRVGLDNLPKSLYFLVNKPLGVVCTCDDPQGRETVLDLLPTALRQKQGLHPVGRLDINSTGALLLTNDGDFTYRLTHPSHQVAKTYHVWVEGHPNQASLDQWRHGIVLSGRRTLPAHVQDLEHLPRETQLEVVLQEGRNRQIRRVAALLGHPVVKLHRIAIGEVQLDLLKSGEYRSLTPVEVEGLVAASKGALPNSESSCS